MSQLVPEEYFFAWMVRHAPQVCLLSERDNECPEARYARVSSALVALLRDCVTEFGYDAIYFGVACQVFDEAIPE